ncbi:hypothetical protein Tco_1092118 [Tanacetum coccineum]|uniref:Uncharacterized protein n=1 Tax=Tanacetum coccineum TaxID=301880 RepID=A0ABQ5IAB0_9ASTR
MQRGGHMQSSALSLSGKGMRQVQRIKCFVGSAQAGGQAFNRGEIAFRGNPGLPDVQNSQDQFTIKMPA